MSRFFKALAQAKRDRALLEQAGRRDRDHAVVAPAPATQADDAQGLQESVPLDPSPLPFPVSPLPPPVSPFPHDALPLTPPDSPLSPTVSPFPSVDRRLVSLLDPTSFEAEQYRSLRHMVEQMRLTTGTSVVGVSSPAVGDGKTITALNLAGALAQAPKARVLLIESDLRRPSLTRYLGLGRERDRGLVEAILEPALPLEAFVTACHQFNLDVLPAGCPQLTSYELLKSPRLETLLEEARKRYDYIVLDTPPLIPLPDCRLIVKLVDTLILVVAAHQTPRKLLEEALNILEPAKLFGIVFNNDDRPLAGYYYRYDYHQKNAKEGRRDRAGRWLSKLLRRPSDSKTPPLNKGG